MYLLIDQLYSKVTTVGMFKDKIQVTSTEH